MKIATITPISHLNLIKNDDYMMCLAHLCRDKTYADFYRDASDRGAYVLLDNGVVETRTPMPSEQILHHAGRTHSDEFILPDTLYDREQTITKGLAGIRVARDQGWTGKLMAVPQGKDVTDWSWCLQSMLEWDIDSIGISRFVSRYFLDRTEALQYARNLIDSDLEIHLLGCHGDPLEIWYADQKFPGRIRGCDSGIASIYTQENLHMSDGEVKPDVELDFKGNLPVSLLKENIAYWEARCRGEKAV